MMLIRLSMRILLLLQNALLCAVAAGRLQPAACLEQYILLQLQAAGCRVLLQGAAAGCGLQAVPVRISGTIPWGGCSAAGRPSCIYYIYT